MTDSSEKRQEASKERNILDLAKNMQDELHIYCKGAAGSGDNFYARTFANLADRADELVKLLESAPETGACAGCERGLPLDGYGHHYGRISNTGPLAPYYLDLTVCTTQKAGERQSMSTLTSNARLASRVQCPKCKGEGLVPREVLGL